MYRLRCVLVCLVAAAPAACDGADREAANPAYAWHDSVMAAMGGTEAWEKIRYLQFRWNVYRDGEKVSDRLHQWDRYDGAYRLETTITGEEEGTRQPLVALFDVTTKTGQAYVDGRPTAPARSDSLVERAYGMFINDSYWLLMPYKWRDPGVILEYLGPESDDDGDWQVFHLSFQNVGLTPGDQYWVFVSADRPHLVGKWRYHLESMDQKGPFIYWRDWQRSGPIMLATLREVEGGSFRIQFTEIEASEDVPEGIFVPPAAAASN